MTGQIAFSTRPTASKESSDPGGMQKEHSQLRNASNSKISKTINDEVRKQKNFKYLIEDKRRSFGKNHIYCPLQDDSTTDLRSFKKHLLQLLALTSEVTTVITVCNAKDVKTVACMHPVLLWAHGCTPSTAWPPRAARCPHGACGEGHWLCSRCRQAGAGSFFSN